MAHDDRGQLGPLDVEPINIRPPFDVRRTLIYDLEASRLDFLAAVHEPLAGIELGSYDERMLRWLAGWDTPTVGTVVSLLHRARTAAPVLDDDEAFAEFGRRVIAAAGRRVAGGDIRSLPKLAALAANVDAVLSGAVIGLRSSGYGWAEIGSYVGITGRAAQQSWSHPGLAE